MALLEKEVFENENARLEIYSNGSIWLGVGIAGLMLELDEYKQLRPLIEALNFELNVAQREEEDNCD
jgi:hypothetical protein